MKQDESGVVQLESSQPQIHSTSSFWSNIHKLPFEKQPGTTSSMNANTSQNRLESTIITPPSTTGMLPSSSTSLAFKQRALIAEKDRNNTTKQTSIDISTNQNYFDIDSFLAKNAKDILESNRNKQQNIMNSTTNLSNSAQKINDINPNNSNPPFSMPMKLRSQLIHVSEQQQKTLNTSNGVQSLANLNKQARSSLLINQQQQQQQQQQSLSSTSRLNQQQQQQSSQQHFLHPPRKSQVITTSMSTQKQKQQGEVDSLFEEARFSYFSKAVDPMVRVKLNSNTSSQSNLLSTVAQSNRHTSNAHQSNSPTPIHAFKNIPPNGSTGTLSFSAASNSSSTSTLASSTNSDNTTTPAVASAAASSLPISIAPYPQQQNVAAAATNSSSMSQSTSFRQLVKQQQQQQQFGSPFSARNSIQTQEDKSNERVAIGSSSIIIKTTPGAMAFSELLQKPLASQTLKPFEISNFKKNIRFKAQVQQQQQQSNQPQQLKQSELIPSKLLNASKALQQQSFNQIPAMQTSQSFRSALTFGATTSSIFTNLNNKISAEQSNNNISKNASCIPYFKNSPPSANSNQKLDQQMQSSQLLLQLQQQQQQSQAQGETHQETHFSQTNSNIKGITKLNTDRQNLQSQQKQQNPQQQSFLELLSQKYQRWPNLAMTQSSLQTYNNTNDNINNGKNKGNLQNTTLPVAVAISTTTASAIVTQETQQSLRHHILNRESSPSIESAEILQRKESLNDQLITQKSLQQIRKSLPPLPLFSRKQHSQFTPFASQNSLTDRGEIKINQSNRNSQANIGSTPSSRTLINISMSENRRKTTVVPSTASATPQTGSAGQSELSQFYSVQSQQQLQSVRMVMEITPFSSERTRDVHELETLMNLPPASEFDENQFDQFAALRFLKPSDPIHNETFDSQDEDLFNYTETLKAESLSNNNNK